MKIKEILENVYNAENSPEGSSPYLELIADGVRENLDAAFNFDGKSNFSIYDLSIDGHEEEHSGLIVLAYPDFLDYFNTKAKELKSGDIDGFVTHSLRKGNTNIDYIIAINGLYTITPGIIAEEIVHGEHVTEHIGESSKINTYWNLFSPITYEFLGGLGQFHIHQQLPEKIREEIGLELPKLEIEKHDLHFELGLDMPHFIGYRIARQFSEKVEESFYKELFHKPNETEVWKMVNGLFIPVIEISIPKDPIFDKASKLIKDDIASKCREIGLEAKVNVSFDNEK